MCRSCFVLFITFSFGVLLKRKQAKQNLIMITLVKDTMIGGGNAPGAPMQQGVPMQPGQQMHQMQGGMVQGQPQGPRSSE